jgi:alanine dehydrogenase
MLVGVTKEIKNHEYRVGLTPGGAAALVRSGHQVLVEKGAGGGVGFTDELYVQTGAQIAPDADTVFASAEMIVKVKEPQPVECRKLRPGQVLFTYLHLAPDPEQTKMLLASDCVAIAYETVTDDHGGLPLLRPMSEVAGRMAIQAGAHALEKAQGGLGVLLPGVPGVPPAKVLVLGGGIVGINAARMALGLGAQVTITDISLPRLAQIDNDFGPRLVTEYSTRENILARLPETDLLVGGVLIPGAAAPKLVTRDMLKLMRQAR